MADETTITFTIPSINQEDLDRNFSIPMASLFKYFQSARMRLPWVGAGYASLSSETPQETRRLVVKTQMVKCDATLRETVANKDVNVVVNLGSIGRTTCEFRYTIKFNDEIVGNGVVLMVCVTGEPGSLTPSPMPERVRSLAPKDDATEKKFMLDKSKIVSNMEIPKASDCLFVHKLFVRYSDEDVNQHANHSAYARYTQDAITNARANDVIFSDQIQTMILEYNAEARANDICEVRLVKLEEEGDIAVFIIRLENATKGNDEESELLIRGLVTLSKHQKSAI